MLCYITCVMLSYITYVMLFCYVIQHIVNVILYNMLLKTESLDNAILAF